MWYKICWHKSYIALLYLQGKVAGKGCCCVSVIRVPPHMTWSFFFAVSSSLSLSMFCFAFRVLPCTCTCVSWQAQKWWAVSPSRGTVWEMDSPSLKSMRRCWHIEPVAVRLWRHVSYPWLLATSFSLLPPNNSPLPAPPTPSLGPKLPHDNVLSLTHCNSYSVYLIFLHKKQNHFCTDEG